MPLIFYDFSDIWNSTATPMQYAYIQIVTNYFLPYSVTICKHCNMLDKLFLYSPHHLREINDKVFEESMIDEWIKNTQAFRPAYNWAFLNSLISRWKHLSFSINKYIHIKMSYHTLKVITSHLFTTLSPLKLTPLNHYVIKFKWFFPLWKSQPKAHVYLCLIAKKNFTF